MIPQSPTREAHQNAASKNSGKLISEIESFKAFADNNKELIKKQRHIRFYTTLLLKDLLDDTPVEKVAEFYNLTLGEI